MRAGTGTLQVMLCLHPDAGLARGGPCCSIHGSPHFAGVGRVAFKGTQRTYDGGNTHVCTHIHISHTCTTYNTHHTYTHTDITSVHLYISHTHTPHTLQKYTSHTITTHTPHTLTPEAKYSGILVISISRLCVFVIMSFVISTQLIKPREISVFLSISFKVHFFITT